MNIVSMALQYLSPALVGKLASALGINSAIADKIIKAAVPVILASLAGKAGSATGARALFDVLAKQDTGLLGKLGNIVGGPQQKTVAEQGTGVLGSLLGSSALGAMTGAISKYSGAGEKATGGLIGMLAPIVLGTLAQQKKSASLDAGGVARLLADQKSNIMAAIPGDVTKLLSGTGLLDAVLPKSAAAAPASLSVTAPQAAAKPFNGWPWAILVGAASLLWAALFGGQPLPWSSIPPPPRLMAGSTDVAGELDSTLKSLHGLMSGIKDKASAEAAMPQLRATQTTIDRLDGAARQLPAEGKRALAGYVASWLPVITPVMTSLLANSAAAPLVKPVLDGLRTKLEGLTKG